jgi:LDH2 family malate/lactate/ureidoglycolate dehydrogenase
MSEFPRVATAPTAVAPPTADEMRALADGTISAVWSGAVNAAALIELINQEIL